MLFGIYVCLYVCMCLFTFPLMINKCVFNRRQAAIETVFCLSVFFCFGAWAGETDDSISRLLWWGLWRATVACVVWRGAGRAMTPA
jgi:hypothetical protein